jgi:hypothetical protein
MYSLWAYRHRHTMLEKQYPLLSPRPLKVSITATLEKLLRHRPSTPMFLIRTVNILFCCTACSWIYDHLMIALISEGVDQRLYFKGLVIELREDPISWWSFTHFSIVTTRFVISTLIVSLVLVIPLTYVILVLISLLSLLLSCAISLTHVISFTLVVYLKLLSLILSEKVASTYSSFMKLLLLSYVEEKRLLRVLFTNVRFTKPLAFNLVFSLSWRLKLTA